MAEDGKWMQEAFSKNPGKLTRKAERAGKSISSYCAEGGHNTATKRECNLAKTEKKISKRHSRKSSKR
jgi:hypothetical protein